MKLKAYFLTIILIVFALFFVSQAYVNKQVYDSRKGLCELEERLYEDYFKIENPTVQDELNYISLQTCRSEANYYWSRYFDYIYLSITFIFLTFISWKIDNLKKKR